jgi:transporter family protein
MRIWLPAALGYSVAIGVMGVAMKLAFRSVEWPLLLMSITAGYVILSVAFIATGAVHIPPKLGSWVVYVVLAGVLGSVAFPMLNIAIRSGPASQVIPLTAVYPLITVGLAVLFLSESVTLLRLVGVVMIVGGGVLVSR